MDTLLEDFVKPFGSADLGDRRRAKRLAGVADRLARHPGGSLPEKMHDPAALKALYRLMNHPDVTHPALLAPHYGWARARMAAHRGVVLIVHDTTELNLTSKRSLHPEPGQLGNGKGSRGWLCHNSLAVTAAGEPLGLAQQLLHARPRRDPKETRAQRRARPDRESRLWKRGRQAIGPTPAGCTWVDVCDRGGDGFEFLDYEHASGQLYLVRSCSNRRCQLGHGPGGPGVKLHDHLRRLPGQGRRPLEVPPGQGQPGRLATVAVAWAAVTLRPPSPGQARGEHRQEPLAVWALRVWEVDAPPGVVPLEWLLLTNVPVESLAAAWERVDWYEWRWPTAEEFHKAQKTGCAIEGPQFTTAGAMRPMVGLLSAVAWLLLRLRWASRQASTASRPAAGYVPREWVRWLSRWRHGREVPGWTVREFFTALARLGGHQGRKGDGAPGWQVLWKGWQKLHTALEFVSPQQGRKSGQT
jgi:Transposase DNA-binding